MFLAAKLKDLAVEKVIQDADNPTDAERLIAIKQCRDEFVGCLMLSGANQDHYAGLKSDLNNQYGFGKDLYPKSPDFCLSVNETRPAQIHAMNAVDDASEASEDKNVIILTQVICSNPEAFTRQSINGQSIHQSRACAHSSCHHSHQLPLQQRNVDNS
jgi:hypothetical protein